METHGLLGCIICIKGLVITIYLFLHVKTQLIIRAMVSLIWLHLRFSEQNTIGLSLLLFCRPQRKIRVELGKTNSYIVSPLMMENRMENEMETAICIGLCGGRLRVKGL